jgi:hypothetical protein
MTLAAAGCAAYVTPHGTYIEPLYPAIVIGPPVVVAPPPVVEVRPLPPVVVVPGRNVYLYDRYYYYRWESGWYWSRDHRGPWHVLPRDRWPSRQVPERSSPSWGR